jgi:hypothetical protein
MYFFDERDQKPRMPEKYVPEDPGLLGCDTVSLDEHFPTLSWHHDPLKHRELLV